MARNTTISASEADVDFELWEAGFTNAQIRHARERGDPLDLIRKPDEQPTEDRVKSGRSRALKYFIGSLASGLGFDLISKSLGLDGGILTSMTAEPAEALADAEMRVARQDSDREYFRKQEEKRLHPEEKRHFWQKLFKNGRNGEEASAVAAEPSAAETRAGDWDGALRAVNQGHLADWVRNGPPESSATARADNASRANSVAPSGRGL